MMVINRGAEEGQAFRRLHLLRRLARMPTLVSLTLARGEVPWQWWRCVFFFLRVGQVTYRG